MKHVSSETKKGDLTVNQTSYTLKTMPVHSIATKFYLMACYPLRGHLGPSFNDIAWRLVEDVLCNAISVIESGTTSIPDYVTVWVGYVSIWQLHAIDCA